MVATRVMEGKAYLEKKDYRNALRTFNIIKSIDRNYPGLDNLIAQANTGLKEADAQEPDARRTGPKSTGDTRRA